MENQEQQPVAAQQPGDAQLSPDSTAALAEVNRLRSTYGDTPAEGRAALAERINQLTRHALYGDPKPGWYGEATPDPRLSDTNPHDPLNDALADGAKALTPQQRTELLTYGKVAGLDADTASLAVDFCARAGLDRVMARQVVQRAAEHSQNGWGNAELSEGEHAALAEKCVQAFGSVDRARNEIGLARAYVEHVGLGEWVDKFAGSMAHDPAVIMAVAYHARVLGLKAKP